MYIRLLQAVGLAAVRTCRRCALLGCRIGAPDRRTLRAVIANRHHVLASYGKALKLVGILEEEAGRTMQVMRPS